IVDLRFSPKRKILNRMMRYDTKTKCLNFLSCFKLRVWAAKCLSFRFDGVAAAVCKCTCRACWWVLSRTSVNCRDRRCTWRFRAGRFLGWMWAWDLRAKRGLRFRCIARGGRLGFHEGERITRQPLGEATAEIH